MLAASAESTVTMPVAESIVMYELVLGDSEKVNTPVPFVAAVVPPDAVKAEDVSEIPWVVVIPDPPATVMPVFTRTFIVLLALALTESVTVIVSM